MSLIARIKDVRNLIARNQRDRRKARTPRHADPDQAPIKPIEPLGDTQPEVPKVGTTDAPGG
jgi:hypothetical protein